MNLEVDSEGGKGDLEVDLEADSEVDFKQDMEGGACCQAQVRSCPGLVHVTAQI